MPNPHGCESFASLNLIGLKEKLSMTTTLFTPTRFFVRTFCFVVCLFSAGSAWSISKQDSEAIHKETGVFLDTVVIGALDKVTARTTTITFKIGEPLKIGTIIVRALRAWKSNPEEESEAKVFFDIVEQLPGQLDSGTVKTKPVFRGWMFQSHRGLSALEHPVYNLWVLDVKGDPNPGILSEEFSNQQKQQVVDEKTQGEIRDLIDRLMDDETGGTPIEIEPISLDIGDNDRPVSNDAVVDEALAQLEPDQDNDHYHADQDQPDQYDTGHQKVAATIDQELMALANGSQSMSLDQGSETESPVNDFRKDSKETWMDHRITDQSVMDQRGKDIPIQY